MIDQYRYENRAMRKGTVISMDATYGDNETATLHGLIASGDDAVEQAVFEMLVESMASGLGSMERSVLRLINEGYTPFEIGRELAIPRQAVDQALTVIRDCYAERGAVC
jgi:DNA-directed RNA polymerase specialized sigma24 family protein